ncbi:type II toxin-antitoxin system HicB family antitoxin [Propionivibrio sp.]|uniref:type II toxin-antitoxin system HicB family antitoxin n=1 Tax=Propionivibrio sp. TaxID=2212460 RepID=UPI002609B5C7|nr:type II toxin-antitoxin system HicB family antitoxin [Propionivibrio sp.]
MRYPIAIEPGDETHAFGVAVPDLPGCFSAGDTLDEAIDSATSDKVERVNISLPARVLRRIDAPAKSADESRSGFIANLALRA